MTNTVSSNGRIYLRGARPGSRYDVQVCHDGTYQIAPNRKGPYVIDRLGRIALPGAKKGSKYLIKIDPDGVYSLMPVDSHKALDETNKEKATD